MATVSLSSGYRDAAGGAASVEIEAATVRELLRRLVDRYPRLEPLFEEGVAVSINGDIYRDIRDLPIPDGAEIFLLPRLQGG
ncbi:MAG TPA: MoaD/ThiS family protein [Pseudomonadales bacterium]